MQVLQRVWLEMGSRLSFHVRDPVREAVDKLAAWVLTKHDESCVLQPYWLQAFKLREGAVRCGRLSLTHAGEDES